MCWYACETNESIKKKLYTNPNYKHLSDFNNSKCTDNVTSGEEGKSWRKEHCNLDRGNKTIGSIGMQLSVL